MKKTLISLASIVGISFGIIGFASSAFAANTCANGVPSDVTGSLDNQMACKSCTSGFVIQGGFNTAGGVCVPATTAVQTVAADTDNNMLTNVMCNVYKIATGKGGKIFAAFVVISVGIGFFTGKVSWGLMIGVAAGIATMFGGPTIVAAISGGSATVCS